MKYSIPLKKRETVAQGTMAFYFEKPNGFLYKAGQYVDMTIPDKLDSQDQNNIRSFSIASAPFEQHLMVAMRMRKSAFKQVLRSLPIGETVTIQGPRGEFTLPKKTSQSLVFLAGGIGITPFLSMLRHITHERLVYSITLFYSNRTPQDAAFLEELQGYANANRTITLIPVMTEQEGHLHETLLKQYVPYLNAARYYLAGSPAMVGAMQAFLYRLRIPMDSLTLDEFSGY